MEKKIGTISIVVTDRTHIEELNRLLSIYGDIIVSRSGIPFREDNLFVISLVVKSDSDSVNALTGKLGRIKGIKVKSILININK